MARTDSVNTGLIVAPQVEAAFEGAQVLEHGGHAADALVTASLVQGVVDPHRCGIGGFGCCTIYNHSRSELLSVDFHGRVGSRAKEDQWTDRFEHAAPDGFGYILRDKVNDVGLRVDHGLRNGGRHRQDPRAVRPTSLEGPRGRGRPSTPSTDSS